MMQLQQWPQPWRALDMARTDRNVPNGGKGHWSLQQRPVTGLEWLQGRTEPSGWERHLPSTEATSREGPGGGPSCEH